MKVFGDAVYFIALLSVRDRWHTRALAISRQPAGPLVTTEWVLTEVGDAFRQQGARQKFIRLLDLLRASRMWTLFHLQAIYSDAARTFLPRDRIKNGR
jgi:predicted nucleic acid-binding protein